MVTLWVYNITIVYKYLHVYYILPFVPNVKIIVFKYSNVIKIHSKYYEYYRLL